MHYDSKAFASACKKVGEDPSLVQGAGGNISLKIDSEKMLVKASGFRLGEVSENSGYAVCDYRKMRDFYSANENAGEIEAVNAVLSSTEPSSLRPSMETGFHAFLGKAVVHTHPVVANIMACMEGGEKLAEGLLGKEMLWVPYVSPGHELAKKIFQLGKKNLPAIIFLESHGLIVHGESLDFCIEKTNWVNGRISAYLKSQGVSLKPYLPDSQSRLPLPKKFIFPDLAVFCSRKDASSVQQELICASAYIQDAIGELGRKPKFLSQEEVFSLLGMESEKYRQEKAR